MKNGKRITLADIAKEVNLPVSKVQYAIGNQASNNKHRVRPEELSAILEAKERMGFILYVSGGSFRPGAVTQSDVAKEAGCCQGAITRFLRGKGKDPLLKKRIEDAIKATGYKPPFKANLAKFYRRKS